jgi:hypothetical protein
MDPGLDIDKKPEDMGPRPSLAQDTLPALTSFPPQQAAGNQAMQNLLRPSTPAPDSPQKPNQEEEQGAPTSPEQEQRWAAEFAGDEARLVGILTSVFYTEDDETQAISILNRWARRQTPADRKQSAAVSQGLLGIHSVYFGLRSSYLDHLFEKLRETKVWTRTGRTTAYEAMFQRFEPQNASQVRSIRDTSSIKFVGREEQADERKEEDLSAEGILGWQAGKIEAAPPSKDIGDEKRADWVISYLNHTPPDKMTPELRRLSDGVRLGKRDFLLRRSHEITPGDRVRFAKEIAGRAVVTVLEYAEWEIGAGAIEAVVPEVLEGALGAETVGAAGRTDAESGAVLEEASAPRSEIGSAAPKDVEPYMGEPGTHLSVKGAKGSPPTPPTEIPAQAFGEAANEDVEVLAAGGEMEPGMKKAAGAELDTPELTMASAQKKVPKSSGAGKPLKPGKPVSPAPSKPTKFGTGKPSQAAREIDVTEPGPAGTVKVDPRTMGAASEVVQIESLQGATKLNNWFKTLDATSGGTMTSVVEGGKVTVKFRNVTGISVKATGLSDAATNLAYLEREMGEAADKLVEFTSWKRTEGSVTHLVQSVENRELHLIFDQQAEIMNERQLFDTMQNLQQDLKSKGVDFQWFVDSMDKRYPGPEWYKRFLAGQKDIKNL